MTIAVLVALAVSVVTAAPIVFIRSLSDFGAPMFIGGN
jgi:ABC-type Fe3+ transport system permease subunit